MKKLIFAVAIVLSGMTAVSAQTKELKADKSNTHSIQAQKEDTPLSARDASEAVQEKKLMTYNEVKSVDVPQTVKNAIAKDYNGATISKAYANAQGEYKLQLTTADKKSETVYVNKKGELINNELKKQ